MDVTELVTNIGWKIMRLYTICSMFCRDTYQNYFQNNDIDVEENYFPFNIIEKDGYTKIIYPTFNIASFKFLQTQIEFEGQKHDINMDQFMVVDNIVLNRHFVMWIMGMQHNIGMDEDDDYIVHVMDHDVNIFTLSVKDYIEIDKDNYLKKCSDV